MIDANNLGCDLTLLQNKKGITISLDDKEGLVVIVRRNDEDHHTIEVQDFRESVPDTRRRYVMFRAEDVLRRKFDRARSSQ